MKIMKKVLSATISLCMMTSVCQWTIPQAYAAASFEGDGTAESPYLISSKDDLFKLSELINSDDTAEEYNNKYYKQTADIDLENESFMPIGTYTGNNKGAGFAGVYDGNYCEIRGLYIKRVKNGEDKTKNYTGVFGWSYEGKIKNLSVNGNIDSPDSTCIGGIVGELGYNGEIVNCSFTGNIKGYNLIGGITGSVWQEGKVECCYFNGTLDTSNEDANVGGIVGKATAGYEDLVKSVNIRNCYAAGLINSDEKAHTGGVIGSITENNDDSKVNLAYNYYLSSMAVLIYIFKRMIP
ncbi:MAG TPA: GLUG motif-containing protein [Ruminococcus flavefaciens]|nr:GLUG motif-containing protein [Ruminococcus flavefaciens]